MCTHKTHTYQKYQLLQPCKENPPYYFLNNSHSKGNMDSSGKVENSLNIKIRKVWKEGKMPFPKQNLESLTKQ